MNTNSIIFNTKPSFTKELYRDICNYGVVLGNFIVTDNENNSHEVTLYELDSRKFWIRNFNGEVIEFREII